MNLLHTQQYSPRRCTTVMIGLSVLVVYPLQYLSTFVVAACWPEHWMRCCLTGTVGNILGEVVQLFAGPGRHTLDCMASLRSHGVCCWSRSKALSSVFWSQGVQLFGDGSRLKNHKHCSMCTATRAALNEGAWCSRDGG